MQIRSSINLNADIRDARGNQKVMLHAVYSGKTMNLSLEVLDEAWAKENRDDVARDVSGFIRDVCGRANAAGIPCCETNEAAVA